MVKELDLFESNHGCGLNVYRPGKKIRNGRNITLQGPELARNGFQRPLGSGRAIICSFSKFEYFDQTSWEQDTKGNWSAEWKPIGEGMVRFPQFFKLLAQSDFDGPLQLHFEYPLGGADSGKRSITIPQEQVLKSMKADLEKVRAYLATAGLAG